MQNGGGGFVESAEFTNQFDALSGSDCDFLQHIQNGIAYYHGKGAAQNAPLVAGFSTIRFFATEYGSKNYIILFRADPGRTELLYIFQRFGEDDSE